MYTGYILKDFKLKDLAFSKIRKRNPPDADDLREWGTFAVRLQVAQV